MKTIAKTLGVARSAPKVRSAGTAKPRRHYPKAQDAALLPVLVVLVAERPTSGSGRISVLLDRNRRREGAAQ